MCTLADQRESRLGSHSGTQHAALKAVIHYCFATRDYFYHELTRTITINIEKPRWIWAKLTVKFNEIKIVRFRGDFKIRRLYIGCIKNFIYPIRSHGRLVTFAFLLA